MALLKLPIIEVEGTPEAMGRAYGAACGERVREFVAQRQRAAKVYLRERGIRDQDAILDLGRRCLEQLKLWDHEAWVEHHATAQGAGLDAAELYAAANYTDIRDIITYPEDREAMTGKTRRVHAPRRAGGGKVDGEGCTAVLVPGKASASGEVIGAQTWDLNPTDIDYVVAVRRRPAAGPRTWSITCAGCPSLIGMNDAGLAVGTTNIKTRGSRVGIPYLSLLHRAIRSATRAAARNAIEGAARAAAHTYWFADAEGVEDIECTADRCVRRGAQGAMARTNHCLDDDNRAREGEKPTSSSIARLARATGAVAGGAQSVDSLRRLFADRADGVDSINRFTEDNQGTSTNACVVAIPARRELHACRGSSDRGEWVALRFD
jgi:isopenicillin-N N-acyltransferase-like protein